MMQTSPRVAPKFLGAEFDPFLCAAVGTDRQGGQLSVMSALARLDLDAWAEAAALTRLPRDMAVQKLAVVLRACPDIPQIMQDAGVVSARLVALLPSSTAARPVLPPSPRASMAGAAVLVFLLALGVMIGMQVASQAPAAHPTTAAMPAPRGAAAPP